MVVSELVGRLFFLLEVEVEVERFSFFSTASSSFFYFF